MLCLKCSIDLIKIKSLCKKCYVSDYVQRNKEKLYSRTKEWKENNKEHVREQKNTYMKKYGKFYKSNNKGKTNALTAKRRAIKLNATPKWLTKEQKKEITIFYINCPEGYEVDHIIPLQGKIVCGLHVPWNLQYLTRSQNAKKSNKLFEK